MASAVKTLDFRLNNFDILRLFAATQVLFHHSIDRLHIEVPWLNYAISFFPGVPIFFVISGFLVSASLERNPDYVKYFRNRFLRIFPGLWGCLLATVVVATLFGFSFLDPAALQWLILQMGGLIYTPGFLKTFGVGSYNGSLWTIPIELQFYFVLPVLYLIFRKNIRLGAIVGFAIFTLIAAFLAGGINADGVATGPETLPEKLLRYSFIPHVYLFFLGVLLQVTKAWQSRLMFGKGAYWIAAAVIVSFFVRDIPLLDVVQKATLAIAVISVAYTWQGGEYLKGVDISYGVYLYHGLVINILIGLSMTGQSWLFAVVLICSYAVGFLSWTFIEKPALRLKWGSRKNASANA